MRTPTRLLVTTSVLASLAVAATPAVGGPDEPGPDDLDECSVPVREVERAGDASCRLTLRGAVDLSPTGGTGQLAVHGDLAAVVRRDDGVVSLVDVSDPAAPVEVGTYDGGTGQPQLDHPLAGDVVFSDDGTILFHARQTSDWSNEGLHVLDVTDPTAPTRTDLAPQGGMLRVAYARLDDTEVVVTLDAVVGMTIFEVVRTPLGARVVPVHVDPLPALKVGGPASAGIVIEPDDPMTAGPVLYVTDGTTGLRVLDIADPADPVELATWDAQGLAALTVEHTADGRTLVRAATEYWFDDATPPELVTLDVRGPGDVVEVGRTNLRDFDGSLAWKLGGLDGDGSLLWAAHGHAGLVAVDTATGRVHHATTDLGVPPENGSPTYADLGWYAMDVHVRGDDVLVTDAITGELRLFAVEPVAAEQ